MSSDRLFAGNTGELLLPETTVFRVVKLSLDGQVQADQFDLSTLDRNSTPPSLSVWSEELTTLVQARRFLNNPEKTHAALLRVEDVKGIRPSPDNVEIPSLNVVWEVLWSDEKAHIRDSRPGAEGHAGIRGLNKPHGLGTCYS